MVEAATASASPAIRTAPELAQLRSCPPVLVCARHAFATAGTARTIPAVRRIPSQTFEPSAPRAVERAELRTASVTDVGLHSTSAARARRTTAARATGVPRDESA